MTHAKQNAAFYKQMRKQMMPGRASDIGSSLERPKVYSAGQSNRKASTMCNHPVSATKALRIVCTIQDFSPSICLQDMKRQSSRPAKNSIFLLCCTANPQQPLCQGHIRRQCPANVLPGGLRHLLIGFWITTPTLTSQTIPLARLWQVRHPALVSAQALESAPALAVLQLPL